MSSFGKCCDCRLTNLLCDLPKALTDKSQVCAVELLLPGYCVSSIETLLPIPIRCQIVKMHLKFL